MYFLPVMERACASAPPLESADTTSACPPAAAHIRAVCPLEFSFAFGLALRTSNAALRRSHRARSQHQRRHPGRSRHVRICSAASSLRTISSFAISDARYKGVTPRSVCAFRFAPAPISRSAVLQIVPMGSPMKSRRAVGARRIHIDALLQQGAGGIAVSALHSIHQPGISGSIEAGTGQHQHDRPGGEAVSYHCPPRQNTNFSASCADRGSLAD